jgi:hypothetical protein
MRRWLIVGFALVLLVACDIDSGPTPDAVASQAAVMRAAAATLTAEAAGQAALPTEAQPPTATPIPPTPLPTQPVPTTAAPQATPIPPPTATSPPPADQVVPGLADQVVQALQGRDMATLATFADPGLGLRFSPYAYVQSSDLVFLPDQLPGLLADPTVYTWGIYDGSGESIDLTFAEYYERFVYDQDYAHAEQVGYNQRLGSGNSIDNSHEFYHDPFVVEYHFSGFDPQYAGMDWRSLRLVFEQHDETWWLVGIIHDEWTI